MQSGWIFGHALAGFKVEGFFAAFFHEAAEVAVGDDAEELAVFVHNSGEAEAFAADFVNDLGDGGIGFHGRKRRARVHDRIDGAEALAELAAGVKRGEVGFVEAAAIEESNGERVAHGEGGGGGGGGSEIEGAGFFFHGDVEDDVGGGGEGGVEVGGEGDEASAKAAKSFDQIEKFTGFAAGGDGEEDVIGDESAEVAVGGFGGVKKEGGRAGTGEGGGDFAADQAGLAHAGDDDAALAIHEEVDGTFEALVQAGDEGGDGLGLDAQDAAGGVEAFARGVSFWRFCGFGGHEDFAAEAPEPVLDSSRARDVSWSFLSFRRSGSSWL